MLPPLLVHSTFHEAVGCYFRNVVFIERVMNELRTLTSLAVPDVPIDHRYFAEKWTVGAPGDRTLKLQPPKFTNNLGGWY